MSDDYINDIPTDIPSTSRTMHFDLDLSKWNGPVNSAAAYPPGWTTTHVQAWTNPQPPLYILINPQEIAERIRPVVEEAVRKALHPDGLPDETRFLQVEATDQDGQKWRGVLYGVKEMEIPE